MALIGGFIVLGVLALLILYFIVVYNQLVNLKHAVAKAWSNIDVLLKQRHDELPKLVETCKQYMKHERETLEQVMHARADRPARMGGSAPGGGTNRPEAARRQSAATRRLRAEKTRNRRPALHSRRGAAT